jgi:hypothetical protein
MRWYFDRMDLNMRTARAAVLLMGLAISAGCSSESEDRYPEGVRTNYIASCIKSGSDRLFCECTLEAMEQKLSYQEFQKMEMGIISGNEVAIEKMAMVMESTNRACELEVNVIR